jgi:hypothetical protein
MPYILALLYNTVLSKESLVCAIAPLIFETYIAPRVFVFYKVVAMRYSLVKIRTLEKLNHTRNLHKQKWLVVS